MGFFEYLIPLLEKDCHVIIPALPGYDENDSQQNFTSVENIAGELAEWLVKIRLPPLMFYMAVLWEVVLF